MEILQAYSLSELETLVDASGLTLVNVFKDGGTWYAVMTA